jgi:hypothetical protein
MDMGRERSFESLTPDEIDAEYNRVLQLIFLNQPFKSLETKMKQRPPHSKEEYERDCRGIQNMKIICKLLGNP